MAEASVRELVAACLEELKPKSQRVRVLVNDFLAYHELRLRAGRLDARELDRLHRYLGELAAAPGDREASSVRPSDVEKWLLGHPRWNSEHTLMGAARCVRALFNWAEGEDRIPRNPIRRFKPFWGAPQPRAASKPDEYRRVMQAARGHGYRRAGACFRLALYFLDETGARVAEMRAADWAQLDWDTALITQRQHKTARKLGQARLIPLNKRVFRVLRFLHRWAGGPAKGPIFVNSRGNRWKRQAFARRFRDCAELANVRPEVSAYSLRHGFTVAGLEAGIGERQLADCLGHTTTKYVSWYGKSTRGNAEYLRALADRLGQSRRQREKAEP